MPRDELLPDWWRDLAETEVGDKPACACGSEDLVPVATPNGHVVARCRDCDGLVETVQIDEGIVETFELRGKARRVWEGTRPDPDPPRAFRAPHRDRLDPDRRRRFSEAVRAAVTAPVPDEVLGDATFPGYDPAVVDPHRTLLNEDDAVQTIS